PCRPTVIRNNIRAIHNIVCRSSALSSRPVVKNSPFTIVPLINNQPQGIRLYTTHNENVDFEIVQRIVKENDTDYTLLDVREPGEVMQGFIPSAINIPLSKMLPAWTMSSEEFEEEFGFKRPKEDDKIIVYCQAGIRSNNAANFLREIGYKNILNYPGSYADYVDKSSQA
ncbi:hypothetical protein INT45_010649, partial [Circinella minor]